MQLKQMEIQILNEFELKLMKVCSKQHILFKSTSEIHSQMISADFLNKAWDTSIKYV